MIEGATAGAHLVVEKIKRFSASPVGIFFHAAGTGLGGVLLLQGFFSMAVSSSAMLMLLPGIIAFNAACSGFSLVERGGRLPAIKFLLVTVAVLLGGAGCASVALFAPWESIVDAGRLFTSVSIAVVFTLLGGWLAGKKHHLYQK